MLNVHALNQLLIHDLIRIIRTTQTISWEYHCKGTEPQIVQVSAISASRRIANAKY